MTQKKAPPNTVPMRYMTKAHFLALRKMEKKMKWGFSKAISDTGLASLPDDVICPVLWTMLHNDDSIRARVAVSENSVIWVDMPIEFYGDLPGRFVSKNLMPDQSMAGLADLL
jgi:hypothetical protein